MKKQIKLGYKVGTGEEIFVNPDHMVVTGVTQKAGKTTCMESLTDRSDRKCIVFKTKIGEKSFLKGTIIPPFFRDRSDWQFVKGLVESTMNMKVDKFEQATIINICKETGGKSLIEFKKRVDQKLTEKINISANVTLTNLQAYLEIVLPKLQSVKFSNTLDLVSGINIIDLERFSRDPEVQSLVISSVADEVLNKFKDVIIIIPESWKFLPQGTGNPCKQMIEEFIRQGAANNNYIWIDSQDIAAVDKKFLKSCSTWLLGYQSESNEVKHTLQQIPLPAASKPKPDDIQQLGTGEFYLAERERVVRVYVQPFWLDDQRAIQIAKGELKVSEIDAPTGIASFKIAVKKDEVTEQEKIDFEKMNRRIQSELNGIREDFFNKIADINEIITGLATEIYNVKNKPEQVIDEDSLVLKVLQKMPTKPVTAGTTGTPVQFDEEALIKKVLSMIPAGEGKVYELAPLEMIKRKFIQEAKDKILKEINNVSDRAKKVLKYMEAVNKNFSTSEVAVKALMLKDGKGSNSAITVNCFKELIDIEVVKKNAEGTHKAILRNRIESYLNSYDAKPEEIELLYNHIIVELLN
jgi:hypothetical protein